jgi:Sulfotransferase family
MPPPIFVVGCPRSGTGLLRNLLRSHSRLAFPPESGFIPALYRGFGDPRSDHEARRLARRILRLRRVRDWELSLTPGSLARCRSYAELVSSIYEEIARRDGKPRWGDKTPSYVVEIPTLLEIFPTAKVIHIYRDGRDVALSWRGLPFGPRNLATAAMRWRRLVAAGRRDGARFPGSYREVSYETLLAEPEETMRALCDFIGERFEESVLRPTPLGFPGRRPLVGTWRPVRPASEAQIVAANVARWKKELTAHQLSLFEGIAGDLLSSLGYEVEGIARRPSVLNLRLARLRSSSRLLLRRFNQRDPSPETFLVMQEARLRAELRGRGRRARSGPARDDQALGAQELAR